MTDRQEQILSHLRLSGRLTVNELAGLCECSAITIRRSLQSLEQENLIVRTPGGAMPVDQVAIEVSFPERLTINSEQKQRIADCACRYVKDGQVLFMDNGSSIYQMAENIKDRRNLTIFTFFLPLVNKLPQNDSWNIILTGGRLRNGRGDMVGPLAEEFVSKVNADAAFFGADGLSEETGVWAVDAESAKLTRLMCENSEKRILLADSSKLSKRAAFSAVDWEYIDYWITDEQTDRELVSRIQQKSVKVELV